MKCPKCGYISFDHHDACPRCRKDISGARAHLNLPGFEVHIPSLLGGEPVGREIPGVTAQISRRGPAVELDGEAGVPSDSKEKGILEDGIEGFTFDLDDLTLDPDDDMGLRRKGPLGDLGLPYDRPGDPRIDLAIENLEVEDLLSDDEADPVGVPDRADGKTSGGVSGSRNNAFALDLEALKLDLEPEGEK